MELWVFFAITAAAAQTVRFALQKVLSATALSAGGATLARFIWSAPVVVLLVCAYGAATGANVDWPKAMFWVWAMVGGLTQIIATILTVQIFRLRAFAVGITFKKTEVLLTALVGFLILGDRITVAGGIAIAAGFVGVVLLSEPPGGGGRINRAAMLGIGSGVFFALSAVTYRAATLSVPASDAVLIGGITLAFVTAWQTLALGLWLRLREPGEVGRVIGAWRQTSLVGVFSIIGSWSWFAAFSLMNAAYVFAVGQVELIFSLLIGWLWFQEKLGAREVAGVAILTLSIVAVALLA